MLCFLTNFKPVGASDLRILLYGPVGAGKSSFINSAVSTILGYPVNIAEATAMCQTTSFTVQYKTHEVKYSSGIKVPIVFNDTMGLEVRRGGVLPEDIKLAMKGHVNDGYTFNSRFALASNNVHYYRRYPSVSDKVHVLVCVLDANVTGIDPSILEKMEKVREAARDLGIPQMAIITHIDEICENTENDVKNVYKSRVLKATMEELSQTVEIPIHNIFPVWNNYEGAQKEEVDVLLLTALKHMIEYGGNNMLKR